MKLLRVRNHGLKKKQSKTHGLTNIVMETAKYINPLYMCILGHNDIPVTLLSYLLLSSYNNNTDTHGLGSHIITFLYTLSLYNAVHF